LRLPIVEIQLSEAYLEQGGRVAERRIVEADYRFGKAIPALGTRRFVVTAPCSGSEILHLHAVSNLGFVHSSLFSILRLTQPA